MITYIITHLLSWIEVNLNLNSKWNYTLIIGQVLQEVEMGQKMSIILWLTTLLLKSSNMRI
jgi:hypothetical protein